MRKILPHTWILLALAITSPSVKAADPGIAYPDPAGGWNYIYRGNLALPGSSGAPFDALDGTFNDQNGSSQWDHSGIGGTLSSSNAPGGLSAITNATHPSELGVSYLRMQDCGDPGQYGSAKAPNNLRLTLVHNMTTDPGWTSSTTILNDGFTFTFRARIPTPAKTTGALDAIYPAFGGEAVTGTQPYPAGGDGGIFLNNGYGFFTIYQTGPGGNGPPRGRIGFSLTVSNDTQAGFTNKTAGYVERANFQGLTMNALNGNVANNNVDFGDGGLVNPQFLPLDPTEWNEFWIVITNDPSGLGTHLVLVYANGSVHPNVFHVTQSNGREGNYASLSTFSLAMPNSDESSAVDIDFIAFKFAAVLPAGASGQPPLISSVSPTPPTQGNLFWPATNGTSFTVAASGANTIPSSGIKLVLNGADVSGNLNITGPNTLLSVTYTGLVDNTVYTGLITATNSDGESATFPLKFDTFTELSSLVIEAEDYNTNSGGFMDNPTPNGYADAVGTPGVDFHDVTPQNNSPDVHFYRNTDTMSTDTSGDTLRQNFGVDYDVTYLEQGEWLNYTRTFPAGKYNVYLRCASQAAQSVRLDLVTGDRTQPSQATAFLGTFLASSSGTGRNYLPLTDAFGSNLVVNLAGVNTLRLTAPDAHANLQMNFLLFVPITGAGTNPPVVGYAAPGPNSTNLLPDAPIQIAIVNRDTSVVTNTISLQFDGSIVSPTITSNITGASISYQPPGQLVINSMHSTRLVFGDGVHTFTNEWTFNVANLPVVPAAWATAPGSGLNSGFNVLMNTVDHEAGAQLFANFADRAEDQFNPGILNPATETYYTNQAPGPNLDGSASELNVINYSANGLAKGAFIGDQVFPNTVADEDLRHIAMAVTAYLDLSAGLHRLGVRRDDGFRLSAGPDFTRAGATLALGAFEPGAVDMTITKTEFDFMVQSSGVYAVRLIFFQNRGGTGDGNVEWYSVDRTTGAATQINSTNAGSVKAYMSRTGLPVGNLQILNVQLSSGNITFSYASVAGHTYFVDFKNLITDSWTLDSGPGVAGDGTIKNFSAPANAPATRFYRVRAQ